MHVQACGMDRAYFRDCATTLIHKTLWVHQWVCILNETSESRYSNPGPTNMVTVPPWTWVSYFRSSSLNFVSPKSKLYVTRSGLKKWVTMSGCEWHALTLLIPRHVGLQCDARRTYLPYFVRGYLIFSVGMCSHSSTLLPRKSHRPQRSVGAGPCVR